jgi:preprotein translocase subunit YajC
MAVKKMLSELKAGDRITTIGGIFGRITSIKDDVLTIEVGSKKTEMVYGRWAVRSLRKARPRTI